MEELSRPLSFKSVALNKEMIRFERLESSNNCVKQFDLIHLFIAWHQLIKSSISDVSRSFESVRLQQKDDTI